MIPSHDILDYSPGAALDASPDGKMFALRAARPGTRHLASQAGFWPDSRSRSLSRTFRTRWCHGLLWHVRRHDSRPYPQTGRKLGAWEGHTGKVSAAAISSDGQFLASGGVDRTIRLLRVATGREVVRWEAHEDWVTALAFSPDNQYLISGSADGVLRLWNVSRIRDELIGLGFNGWGLKRALNGHAHPFNPSRKHVTARRGESVE